MASTTAPLLQSARDAIEDYLIGAFVGVILLCAAPSWLLWSGVRGCAVVLAAVLLGPLVGRRRKRKRVPAAGKAVFISGCDSGFGHLTAKKLYHEGFTVFAGCLLPDGHGANELKTFTSPKLHVVPLDVTSDQSIAAAAEYVGEHLNDDQLWAIINNAGINDGGEVLWSEIEVFRKVIDVNTFGVVRVTKAFLPLLIQYKGRVVTVASASGRYSYPGVVPYCMSKTSAISFCDGLRLEMYKFGVKVITVEPWTFRTPITQEQNVLGYISKTWEAASPEIKQLYPKNYIQRYKKAAANVLNWSTSENLDLVIDCLCEAVMAINPKYSYNPGTLYARLAFWVLEKCPKPIADFLIVKQMGAL